MAFLEKHAVLERNVTLLAIFAFLVVTIGGLVQIVPLFYLDNTIEEVEGMRPYTPLELAGYPLLMPMVDGTLIGVFLSDLSVIRRYLICIPNASVYNSLF